MAATRVRHFKKITHLCHLTIYDKHLDTLNATFLLKLKILKRWPTDYSYF